MSSRSCRSILTKRKYSSDKAGAADALGRGVSRGMQENLLLIKAALNLTAGAEVDVYIRSKKLVKGVDIVMNVVEAISLLKSITYMKMLKRNVID